MDRNREIVELLRELARLTEIDEGGAMSFRGRAYENAAAELELQRADITALTEKELEALHAVGKSMAKKIREWADTGKLAKLEELRAKYPPSLIALTRIPGLGPKRVLKLRAELGVESIEQLRAAVAAQQVRGLAGFGAKMEQQIAKALERTGGGERRPLHEALPLARALVAALAELPGAERVQYGGSVRRFRETIADIDILVAAADAAPIMARFTNLPQAARVLAHGDTKSAIETPQGLQVDLRVVEARCWGAALLYFTGSKAHNIELRQRALDRGWTLNEYALAELDSEKPVAGATEEEIYAALGLPWIPPPMREGSGEIAAAAAGTLPAWPSADDVPAPADLPERTLDAEGNLEGSGDAPCAAAIRSLFDLDRDRQTRRLVRAAGDPRVRRLRHL
ncbi:MAG TPA: helix-hairpin-helix domain-containing protein, partial [Kofleriaceae bacterium]|nr:helix-hairpin-helix domain-containing protein [Kofleriaceae bacterium]